MKRIIKSIIALISVVLLSSCSLPGLSNAADSDTITIASLGSTEAEIMGFIVEGMVEHYIPIDANRITNLGSSSMNHAALQTGDANVASVRYTGTSLTGELGQEPITDPQLALEKVVKGFEEEFNQTWYTTYGFANTYAFMVRREDAEELGLEKVSDLEEYADTFKVGVDNSWLEREGDGYDGFVQTYGFDFDNLYPMAIGLVYTAIANEEIDVALGYSTDGRIISEDLKVLEDDRHLFPPYDASPVATNEIRARYPDLDKVMAKLAGAISNEEMQRLNFTADNYLLEPSTVAKEWLLRHNYFEDKEPYLEPVRKKEVE